MKIFSKDWTMKNKRKHVSTWDSKMPTGAASTTESPASQYAQDPQDPRCPFGAASSEVHPSERSDTDESNSGALSPSFPQRCECKIVRLVLCGGEPRCCGSEMPRAQGVPRAQRNAAVRVWGGEPTGRQPIGDWAYVLRGAVAWGGGWGWEGGGGGRGGGKRPGTGLGQTEGGGVGDWGREMARGPMGCGDAGRVALGPAPAAGRALAGAVEVGGVGRLPGAKGEIHIMLPNISTATVHQWGTGHKRCPAH